MVLSKVLFGVFFSLCFFYSVYISPLLIFAHQENQQIINDYKVSISQDPLSPFVGEDVQVNFELKMEDGTPATNINGKLIIKKFKTKTYIEKESETESEIIYQEKSQADANGIVGLAYKFSKEGFYDIEFIWGDDIENESAGLEIHVREPISFFTKQEVIKRIWVFTGVAFVGFIAGSIVTFAFLTITLHPKK